MDGANAGPSNNDGVLAAFQPNAIISNETYLANLRKIQEIHAQLESFNMHNEEGHRRFMEHELQQRIRAGQEAQIMLTQMQRAGRSLHPPTAVSPVVSSNVNGNVLPHYQTVNGNVILPTTASIVEVPSSSSAAKTSRVDASQQPIAYGAQPRLSQPVFQYGQNQQDSRFIASQPGPSQGISQQPQNQSQPTYSVSPDPFRQPTSSNFYGSSAANYAPHWASQSMQVPVQAPSSQAFISAYNNVDHNVQYQGKPQQVQIPARTSSSLDGALGEPGSSPHTTTAHRSFSTQAFQTPQPSATAAPPQVQPDHTSRPVEVETSASHQNSYAPMKKEAFAQRLQIVLKEMGPDYARQFLMSYPRAIEYMGQAGQIFSASSTSGAAAAAAVPSTTHARTVHTSAPNVSAATSSAPKEPMPAPSAPKMDVPTLAAPRASSSKLPANYQRIPVPPLPGSFGGGVTSRTVAPETFPRNSSTDAAPSTSQPRRAGPQSATTSAVPSLPEKPIAPSQGTSVPQTSTYRVPAPPSASLPLIFRPRNQLIPDTLSASPRPWTSAIQEPVHVPQPQLQDKAVIRPSGPFHNEGPMRGYTITPEYMQEVQMQRLRREQEKIAQLKNRQDASGSSSRPQLTVPAVVKSHITTDRPASDVGPNGIAAVFNGVAQSHISRTAQKVPVSTSEVEQHTPAPAAPEKGPAAAPENVPVAGPPRTPAQADKRRLAKDILRLLGREVDSADSAVREDQAVARLEQDKRQSNGFPAVISQGMSQVQSLEGGHKQPQAENDRSDGDVVMTSREEEEEEEEALPSSSTRVVSQSQMVTPPSLPEIEPDVEVSISTQPQGIDPARIDITMEELSQEVHDVPMTPSPPPIPQISGSSTLAPVYQPQPVILSPVPMFGQPSNLLTGGSSSSRVPLFLPSPAGTPAAASPSPNAIIVDGITESKVAESVEEMPKAGPSKRGKRMGLKKMYVMVPPPPAWVKEVQRKKQKGKMKARRGNSSGEEAQSQRYNEVEQFMIEDSSERITPRSCKWGYCDIILNSGKNLGQHLIKLHLHDQEVGPFICHWQNCTKRLTSMQKLKQHVTTHYLFPIYCPVAGCDEHFDHPVHAMQHESMHKNLNIPVELKRSAKPFVPQVPPSVGSVPLALPSYRIEARHARPALISAQRHAILSPKVLRRIIGSINPSAKKQNAAYVLRNPRQLEDVSQAQPARPDEYDFLAFLWGPTEVPALDDLPSTTVSQLVDEGIVFWGSENSASTTKLLDDPTDGSQPDNMDRNSERSADGLDGLDPPESASMGQIEIDQVTTRLAEMAGTLEEGEIMESHSGEEAAVDVMLV